ncbi:PIG-L deacetylase family protein [Candidatus Latescibacterota bacterium]
MKRRKFISRTIAGSAIAGGTAGLLGSQPAQAYQSAYLTYADDVVVERDQPGQPHKGKVLMAIHPHVDDVPLYCAGAVAKFIKEGYTGYLLKTANDEELLDTAGKGAVGSDKDNDEIAKVLGLKKAFNLGYRKHRFTDISKKELLMQIIFLFRLLKVDTVFCMEPWSHYDANYDHIITGEAVEEAYWHASQPEDYPEYTKTGIAPHSVKDVYWYARGPQLVDRVVDISSVVDIKVEANIANRTWGPSLDRGVRLREQLAKENKKLDVLEGDDYTANFNFIKEFQMEGDKEVGKKYGLEYAEAYHHIGSEMFEPVIREGRTPKLDDYIKKYAKPLR